MPTIGLISDTHGLLREEALAALRGSRLIVHAGDVGGVDVLEGLGGVAPVRAVRGNTDRGALARDLPASDVIDLSAPGGDAAGGSHGPLAYVLHELERLDLDPVAAGFRVVVYGHTHEPSVQQRDGVLYVNPGAAGHRRFHLPVTVGRLHVDGAEIRAEILHLDVGR